MTYDRLNKTHALYENADITCMACIAEDAFDVDAMLMEVVRPLARAAPDVDDPAVDGVRPRQHVLAILTERPINPGVP